MSRIIVDYNGINGYSDNTHRGNIMTVFQKREISIRYWLQGRGYFKALKSMEFAKGYHTGVRKDGVTPEFDHQISIVHYLRTLNLLDMEDVICAAFLHDTREDYNVADMVIRNMFGDKVAIAVDALTKEFNGVRRDENDVFRNIATNIIASVVKGADRIHNHQTMVGVFTVEKQKKYIAETNEYFFDMLKTARRLFPEQEPAYENIKHVLKSQIALIEATHV